MKTENLNQQLIRLLHIEMKTPVFVDPEVFNDLYETTYLSVFRYVYGLTGGPRTLVEDLTAETFLRAWKSRFSYSDTSTNGIRWVMKIAHNLVIDHYRHASTNILIIEDPVNEEIPDRSQENHPEEALLSSERQQYVMSLLTKLTIEQREMLALRYLLDWKVQQIGQYLEIPENTVSVSIHRALEKLRTNYLIDKE